jgi:hypothetical protein
MQSVLPKVSDIHDQTNSPVKKEIKNIWVPLIFIFFFFYILGIFQVLLGANDIYS